MIWPNLPARNTGIRPLRAAVLAATVAAVGLAACGDDGSNLFGGGASSTFDRDTFPFTFDYPDDFEERSDESEFAYELGSESDETVVIELAEANGLNVQRFTLNIEIDETNLDIVKDEFDGLLRQVDPTAEGREDEIAGFLALIYDTVELVAVEEDVESRLVALFEGDQEYLIACQSTPEYRDEVQEACDQALDTLTRR